MNLPDEKILFDFDYIRIKQSDIDRFWDKVEIRDKDECWNWKAGRTAGKSQKHYGAFWVDNKTIGAHQFSIAIMRGINIFKLYKENFNTQICHTCDNYACVNPNHLYIGNGKTNAKDRDNRNRSRWKDYIKPPKILKGKANWLKSITGSNSKIAKLNEEKVREVRIAYMNTNLPIKKFCVGFGKKFNVSYDTIYLVVTNKTWKHVSIEEK